MCNLGHSFASTTEGKKTSLLHNSLIFQFFLTGGLFCCAFRLPRIVGCSVSVVKDPARSDYLWNLIIFNDAEIISPLDTSRNRGGSAKAVKCYMNYAMHGLQH